MTVDEALSYQGVVADGLPGGVTFVVPVGSVAAVVTSRHGENDLLVRLLLGLSKPAVGSITVLGVEVGTSPEKALCELRKRISVVYQSGGLISNLKVWENLVLPLEYHSLCPRSEIEERGLAVLHRVGYSGSPAELPGHLSPYERRLIGLARAMIAPPRVIVYNAILAGLSGDEKDNIVSAILEFHREEPQRTSLFMTSNPETIGEIPLDCRIVLKGSASNG